MAFGLVPHYSVVFPIEDLTPVQFLTVIKETIKKIEWNLSRADVNGLVAYTKFRRRSVNEKIRLTVEEGLVTLKSESVGGQFFDGGRNRKNVEQFISAYDEVRTSLTSDQIDSMSADLAVKELNVTPAEAGSAEGEIHADENTKGMLSILIPVKGYYVTPILISLNILVFLLMAISGVSILAPETQSLLNWGANYRPVTLAGEPWRLLTCCFLHIGIFHLLFNMYALLYIGILLEPLLGSKRFAIAYIVTGIIASVTSLYWHQMTVSAGASGAIFGMYGVFLAMLTTNLIEKSRRKAFLTSIAIFVGYNLLNGMKGGIDNAAHIGGLVSGMMLGYSFYPGLTKMENRKLDIALPAVLILCLFIFSSWAYFKIPNDIVKYDKQMKTFFTREEKALELYKMPDSTPKEIVLNEIKNRDQILWNQNKTMVARLDKLDLPADIHLRNKKLILYCDFRISSNELMYKSIDENSHEYDGEINQVNNRIDSLIKTLK